MNKNNWTNATARNFRIAHTVTEGEKETKKKKKRAREREDGVYNSRNNIRPQILCRRFTNIFFLSLLQKLVQPFFDIVSTLVGGLRGMEQGVEESEERRTVSSQPATSHMYYIIMWFTHADHGRWPNKMTYFIRYMVLHTYTKCHRDNYYIMQQHFHFFLFSSLSFSLLLILRI